MKKKSLILFFILSLSSASFSQTITFCDTLREFYFLGATDSLIFIKCPNPMSGWDHLYAYDAKSLKRTGFYNCDIQDKENGRLYFATPVVMDGKLTYFTSQGKIFGKKSIYRFIQPFNDRSFPIDTLVKEKREWTSRSFSFKGSGYILPDILKLNEDSILLFIRTAPIEMYKQPTPDGNAKATCVLYDKKLNRIESALEFKNYEIDDLKSGKINLAKEKNFIPEAPALPKCSYQKINYVFDKEKKQYRMFGLFTFDTVRQPHLADGYFEYWTDGKDGGVISKRIEVFSNENRSKLFPETKHNVFGKNLDQIDQYTSFEFANGTYVTVYHRKEIEILFDSKTKSSYTHTIFKDIYILAVDKEGKFLWMNQIDRYVNQDNDCDTPSCLPYMTVLHGNTSANIFYYTRDNGLVIQSNLLGTRQVFNYSFNDGGVSSQKELGDDLKNMYYLRNIFPISKNVYLGMLQIGRQKYCLTKIVLK